MSAEQSPHGQGKPPIHHIIVNARPKQVTGDTISYAQVVALAFPADPVEQFLYSVQYTGPQIPDGTLAEGQSVALRNGMKFDVTKTNRS